MLRRAGLRPQIAFWVLLPVALLLAGVGLLMTLGAERLMYDMVRTRNNDLARMAAAAVDHSLKRNLWLVQTVADIEARHLHDPAAQRQVLEASSDFLSRFDVGVVLLDATGKVIATDLRHPQWMGMDLSSRDYFQQVKASRQPVISSVMADILTQRDFVAMAIPILDKEGRFYQAVVGGFFLETRQFAHELARLQGERPFTIYLVDGHGVIVHHYAVAIMRNREEEYKHLARELHDETAQTLVALVQRLDLTKRALQTDPAKAAKELSAVQELAEYILADVRRMSYNLRPLILEDLGLIAALQALTEDANQVYPACQTHFELIGTPCRLAAEEELIIFRIVQEAVNNACRHAYPEHVTVTLSFEPSDVRVAIEDDGCGFEMPPARELAHSGHLGLLGMQERAQLIGGQLEIRSSPGRGTRVTLQFRPS